MYKSFSSIESEQLVEGNTFPKDTYDETNLLKQVQDRILHKFVSERNKRYDYQRHIYEGKTIVIVNLSRAVTREIGAFTKFLDFIIDEGARNIVIDLTHADFIDSTFAGLLVQLLKIVKEFGGDVRLVMDLSKVIYYQSTFNIMVKTFCIYEDYKVAMNSFNSCKEKNRITLER